jgi:tRNA(adenine34) deaminase
MPQLIALARAAARAGEVPVAAAIVDSKGEVIAQAHNETQARGDATAHAELLAIQAACAKLGKKYLEGCTLIVTLEPCAMCAGAIAHAKIARVVYGAQDAKGGAVEHGARVFSQPTCHHKPEIIGGVMEAQCGALLQEFFREKRG